jgi:acylphosphatase
MIKRMTCVISGRAQGVMFRDFIQRNARTLGLIGQVWNGRDGTVTVVAEGDEALLGELVGRVKQGPPLARVDTVATTYADATGEFGGFHIVIRSEKNKNKKEKGSER